MNRQQNTRITRETSNKKQMEEKQVFTRKINKKCEGEE